MPSSEDLDAARRRLLYRCWHRGTREMDLILGRYAEARIPEMSEPELAALEAILEIEEKELFVWLTRGASGDEPAIVTDIRRFHARHPVSEDDPA